MICYCRIIMDDHHVTIWRIEQLCFCVFCCAFVFSSVCEMDLFAATCGLETESLPCVHCLKNKLGNHQLRWLWESLLPWHVETTCSSIIWVAAAVASGASAQPPTKPRHGGRTSTPLPKTFYSTSTHTMSSSNELVPPQLAFFAWSGVAHAVVPAGGRVASRVWGTVRREAF